MTHPRLIGCHRLKLVLIGKSLLVVEAALGGVLKGRLYAQLFLLDRMAGDRARRFESDDSSTDSGLVGRVGGQAPGAVILSRFFFSIDDFLVCLRVAVLLTDLIGGQQPLLDLGSVEIVGHLLEFERELGVDVGFVQFY